MANIGIDLGTTHSLVAAVFGGKARCLLDDDERALLPSVVHYNDQGEATSVGYDAIEETDGISFRSIKRYMGRSPKDIPDCLYDIDEKEERAFRFIAGSKSITAVEISATILKALSDRAEECFFAKPTGAVITVPAYFDDAQRQATKDAARVAGLELLRLLNEPTAAALAYGLQTGKNGIKVAVYDLGGGTFDISILELSDGVFQVRSTAGDTALGGDDFDRVLAEEFLRQCGQERPDNATFRRLLQVAEKAKRQLSDQESVQISFDGAECVISRTQFEALIGPVLERTGTACLQALGDAKYTTTDIDEVVLVGGSTRVPMVSRFVEKIFGSKPHTDLDPDRVVALGAAIQADLLSGKSEIEEDILLLDVLPLSLGVEVMGGVVERLIPRCSPIPASASQRFTTHVDGQTGMQIHVLQGERELVSDNRSLARFSLKGLPDLPAGIPRIEVSFVVDSNGMLSVRAREEFTNVEASIDVQPSYGIDDDEIEQMLEDAIDNASTDVEKRMLIEARIEAEQILRSLRKALEVDGHLISDSEREGLSEACGQLESILESDERKRISDMSHRLDEISAPFAQKRIERDLAIALEGRSADEVASHLGME
ncbi:MAG: Fe-S protein assembly chaperone HscA [Myxococcota bacterium]|nr:Fe-S protein assembly chaperone HscA [Myxococcota bacterium]